jgi:hypothetical protein
VYFTYENNTVCGTSNRDSELRHKSRPSPEPGRSAIRSRIHYCSLRIEGIHWQAVFVVWLVIFDASAGAGFLSRSLVSIQLAAGARSDEILRTLDISAIANKK